MLLGASIDALFAQRKKERMMAKKKVEANTKDRRNAFKQQLEAKARPSREVWVANEP